MASRRSTVSIKVNGVEEVIKNINICEDRIKNLRPAWEKIAQDFRETERKVFDSQGGYGSRSKWSPLSPQYNAWKQISYAGKPILQLTGHLKNSLTTKGADHVEIIEAKKLTIGSTDPKFGWHQNGNYNLPARPPVTVTKYQGTKWVKIIRNHIINTEGEGI